MTTIHRPLVTLLPLLLSLSSTAGAHDCAHAACIERLEDLTIESLREESWQSSPRLLTTHPADGPPPESASGASHMLSYDSDGLQLLSRMLIPTASPPAEGYPTVVLLHGWVGKSNAPGYDFAAAQDSLQGEIAARLVDSGFAVLIPGYRGHGSHAGRTADGGEFLEAWDTRSYLSPVFYARDVLNLLAGVIERQRRTSGQAGEASLPHFDLDRLSLVAHSQGGDVALTVLAVTGDNPNTSIRINAASIWAGNIPPRFEQANTFGPMADTLQAFMSGDGSWTGSARGRNGEINGDFVFPWPPDWIGTLDTDSDAWTWQAAQWDTPTVRESLQHTYSEMYRTINRYSADMGDAQFTLTRLATGKLEVVHDPRIARIMPGIGGYNFASYLQQPLLLHFSDRDYYSIPRWNTRLAANIRQAGGIAWAFEYPGTTHSLKRSSQAWYSPPGTQAGATTALQRDLNVFRGRAPLNDSAVLE